MIDFGITYEKRKYVCLSIPFLIIQFCWYKPKKDDFFCGDIIKHNWSMLKINRCIPCERGVKKMSSLLIDKLDKV